MKTPDLMPILSAGAHASPAEGACIMEYASLLAGEEWTDRPECTHPALAGAARYVNDCLGDEARQKLLPLLPRLMGTTSDDETVGLKLGIFAARHVLPLVPGKYRAKYERAIDAAESVVDGTGTRRDARALRVAFDIEGIAFEILFGSSVRIAVDAIDCATHAVALVDGNPAGDAVEEAAYAAGWLRYALERAGTADADLIAFLTSLIDEYDRITGRGQVDPLTESDLKVLQEATK